MCLAVPVCVVEYLAESTIKARVGEGETFVEASTLLLPEPPKVGDYLILHAGFALRVLDPLEAEESIKILRQVAEVEGVPIDF